jgi:hypothetical protein
VEAVDLDSVQPQAVSGLGGVGCSLATRHSDGDDPCYSAHGKGGQQFVELVLGILVLGQEALGSSLLLLVDDEGCGDGCEDEIVEERKGEGLVLGGDDGGEEGADDGHSDDAELQGLEPTQTRGNVAWDGERKRHDEGGCVVRLREDAHMY